MVLGVLKTLLGLAILSLVFSLPFIGLYLASELLRPRMSGYLRGGETKD